MVVYRSVGCGVHEGHHAELVCFMRGCYLMLIVLVMVRWRLAEKPSYATRNWGVCPV